MNRKRNIIFLDLHGVMVFNGEVPESNLQALSKLLEKTEAKIVITSSVRHYMRLDMIKNLFPKYISQHIIGATPIIKLEYNSVLKNRKESCNYNQLTRKSQRGLEIQSWLSGNKDRLGCKISKFNSYVIIDNSYHGILMSQKNNFYFIENQKVEKGLNKWDISKILKILNNY